MRRSSFSVFAAVVVGGLLVATPAEAIDDVEGDRTTTSKLREVKLPGLPRDGNGSDGGASALSNAVEEARATKKPVPVEALTSATEEFTANPDGTVTRETAQVPVRVERGDDWVDIDPALAKSGDQLEPKAIAGDVTFSATGEGVLAEASFGRTSVSLSTPEMALQAPTVEGAVATYEPTETSTGRETDVAPDSETPAAESSEAEPQMADGEESVRVAVKNDGFAAHVVLDEMPADAPEYVFELGVEGLTPSLVDGVLSFADAGGKEVARSLPLRMWDAQVDKAGDPTNVAAVDANLNETDSGWQLVLSPSMDYLGAESTQYPVVVDPDIASVSRKGDTTFRNGADASTFFGDEPRLDVGRNDGKINRTFVSFDYNSYLGATITDAKLKMYQYYAPSCTAQPINVHSMTGGDGDKPVWNGQPTHTTDKRFTVSKSFNRGSSGCARGAESIDVTPIVSGWAGAQVGPHAKPFALQDVHENRQAFIIRAGSESSDAQYKRFCSREWSSDLLYCNSASVVPVLSVTFEPEIGEQSWYSMTERQLDERTTLKVNNKNANLFVQSIDINVKGIGTDMTINRTYNSQATDVGPMGRSWGLNVGPDVWLEKKSEYRYDFHTPGGTILGSFVRQSADSASANYKQFRAPLGGVGAELEETGDGFVLSFRKTQMKYAFNEPNSDGDMFMTAMRDRSDNRISIDYSGTAGSRPKIATITDTVDRVLTPTYTGDVVTKWTTQNLSGVGVREWSYTYANGYLTSATDAMGATTDYAYRAPAGGVRLLSTITAPANDSGSRPTTQFTYATDAGQLATAAYRFGNNTADVYTFSWDLNSGRVAACDGNGDISTVVTDARGNDTTYCYDARDNSASDAKTWVYDALGNARSQDYNSDNQPVNATNSTGQGVAGGSTVSAYNDNISDQLSSVTAPRSGGAASGESSSMTYDDDSALPGGAYLPLSGKDGAGDCNRYGYDDKGRTSTTFSGITANASGDCGSSAGAREFHQEYNDNGTLDMTWDANSGDNPATEDKTRYTYWATTDAGYVAGSKGQVKSIGKPGSDCSTGTARRLCTSYTYDGAGRVLTVTDGRGIVTSYEYDANDRTTKVLFEGATSCAAGLNPYANCIQYVYDAAGNLTQRFEDSGQSIFDFDRLNRQTIQITPVGTLGQDRVEYAYDAVGNMTGYSQAFNSISSDVTVYTYDDANRPTAVDSAVGTFSLDVDDDGRTTGINFPNPNNSFGLDLTFDYTKAGKPTELEWRIPSTNIRVGTWSYDYTKGNNDVSQLQARTLDVNGNSDQEGTTDYTYDEQRLVATDNSSTIGPDYDYTYDNVGNVLSESTGSTTTHYGYNKAGERCWQGSTQGNAAQKLSRTCATGPTGSTNLTQDAAGNNTGTSGDPVGYNERSQVTQIGGTVQDYLDQGNDLRRNRGSERHLSGSMGLTATTSSTSGTVYYTRDPSGNILAGRIGNATWYYVTEPNGNVAALTDVNGANLGAYEYSPYGDTEVLGNVAFNPLRWLGVWQETTTSNGDQTYKLGARYYQTSGAFTQPDAIAGNLSDPRTLTAYNYAGADPINQQDASGMAFTDFVKDADFLNLTSAFGKASSAISVGTIGYQVFTGDLKGAAASAVGLGVGFGIGAACAPAAVTGVGAIGCAAVSSVGGAAAASATSEVLK